MLHTREQIAARIRALFSKTVSNGATEAEATAAAAKAKELLDKHQFSMSELELEKEGTEQYRSPAEELKQGSYEVRSRLSKSIAAFADCKTWVVITAGRGANPVVFFGLKSDIDFASWLLDSLEIFVKKEADRYKLGQLVDNLGTTGEFYAPPLLEMNAFRAGCIDKINQRLDFEAAKRRENLRTHSPNSIMVIKNALVNSDFNKLGLNFRKVGYKGGYRGDNAYRAGSNAGDRASFGRPVQSNSTLRIGKN